MISTHGLIGRVSLKVRIGNVRMMAQREFGMKVHGKK
jgi:hypothetical protein